SRGSTVAEYELDVSARKTAEAARRQSEERYRTLFETIDVGFCVIEMVYEGGRPVDYRFIEVNPAFERQTGLKNATGTTVRAHVPGHEQHWFDLYAEVAETGEPARFVQEARALGRWYEVAAFRAGGFGDRRVGVLFNDITARVAHEEAQRGAARRKDEFLATLAHELRNPLAPISNAVSILRLRDGDDDLRLVGDMIDRQVRHLVRLVDDLLDVSRITFGKITLRRTRLDLRAAASDAVATSEPLLIAGGHRLEADLGAQPVWVDADPVRLSQVISNLLNNAARYTRHAGRVALRVAPQGDQACVVVEDNGVGIEPAMLEHIFEPFVQLEPRDAAAVGGIGMGLALARALVHLHGGSIRAESGGAGTGSRFVVCLSLAEAPEEVEAGDARARTSPSRWTSAR
ncbi:MAG TPA: PAS domain-containing sensor histidine kinase, partial [Conexibacter sp.]|nr:PAS domain-containing sensor histidine kinase [Conexibacter sp.]